MPLTKATPEVIDVDKLTLNIKSNTLTDGVRDYVDTNVTTLEESISTLETTLVESIANNFTTLNESILLLEENTNKAISALKTSLKTQVIQDLIKRFAVPIGTICMWPSDTIMPNVNDYGTYVPLNGQWLLKAEYPELYLLLKNGTGICIYGENNTYFIVPAFVGRVPMMLGATYDTNIYNPGTFLIANYGGTFQHTLSISEMPNHNHTINEGQTLPTTGGQLTSGDDVTSTAFATQTSSSVGGNQPHNIMQPYIVTNMIIKAKHAPSIIY